MGSKEKRAEKITVFDRNNIPASRSYSSLTDLCLPLLPCVCDSRDEIRGIFNQINSGGSVAPGFKTAFKGDTHLNGRYRF